MDINIRSQWKRESAIKYPQSMDLVMEDLPALIFAAGSSTTTTTTTVDDDISWDDWSPHLNWSHENIQQFNMYTKFDNPFSPAASDPNFAAATHSVQKWSSNTSSPDTTSTSLITFSVDKGQRLLHLLTATAEALSGDHNGRDLARVILVRLKELLSTDNAGSGLERLAAHFADALQALLDGDATALRRAELSQPSHRCYPATEVLMAFQLLQDMSPFASFGYLTANQAILEAVAGERRVHIVDYDIAEGVQWASLIQAMASRNNAAPPHHLKITAVSNGSRRSASAARETGRRLATFAASVGQPFSFRLCRLDQQKQFLPEAVTVVKGEPVVFNFVLHPSQIGPGYGSMASVGSFLAGAVPLEARIVTIVEEQGASSTEEKDGFLQRFMIELERYMAVWESLESGFPKQGRVREMVEKVILGPMIAGAVRRAYGRGDRIEAAAGEYGEWMEVAGFRKVGLSFFNLCQAQLLLGLFHEEYKVESDALNKIVLSWKSRRLLSASVWAIPNLRSPSPSPSPALNSESISL